MSKMFQASAREASPNPGDDHSLKPQASLSRTHLTRPSPEAAAELARYISQMTAELAGMAGAARLEMLAYFLCMARNEAEMAAAQATDPVSTFEN